MVPERLSDYCELLAHVAASCAYGADMETWESHVHHLLRHLAHQRPDACEMAALEKLAGYATGLGVRNGALWPHADRAQWASLAQMIAGVAQRRAA